MFLACRGRRQPNVRNSVSKENFSILSSYVQNSLHLVVLPRSRHRPLSVPTTLSVLLSSRGHCVASGVVVFRRGVFQEFY